MSERVIADTQKMKVLLVIPWDEERGGVVSVARNLTRYLQSRGHHVVFFHPGTTLFLRRRTTKLGFDGATLRLVLPYGERYRLLRVVVFPFLFAAGLIQLLWFLRRERVQIINLHYVEDGFAYFAVCRRLLPIRLVTSIHGRDAFYREKPRSRYSRAFRFLIRCSDLVVLPSSSYRKKLLQAFPAIGKKVVFIHNGIDPVQFAPMDEERVGRPIAERYMLCVAELRDYKGIDILLRAAKPLLDNEDSVSLVLAGDGPLRQPLEELAASLGIRDRTSFLGTKGAADIAALMRGCELLVLPSREEPFGIVLIEAMACKTPIVASEIGGIPEIIEHERTGILVEPENPYALTEALRTVLANEDLRRRLAENGYRRAMERFCFQHTGAAYENAFASLLGVQLPESLAA